MNPIRSALRHFLPKPTNQLKKAIRAFASYELGVVQPQPVQHVRGMGVPRINLVLPVLSEKNSFGGVATALRFFDAVRVHFSKARIIVTQEYRFEFEPARWKGWTIDGGSNGVTAKASISFLGGSRESVSVSDDDFFIATHWTTAYQVKAWRARQQRAIDAAHKPFVYLIQDFEPGFYAWSSEYLLADSTYRPAKDILAVFNTSLLAEYFRTRGYTFANQCVFSPKINPYLASILNERAIFTKKRLILVYGRPSSDRNAFALLLAGLSGWASSYQRAGEWTVLSVGESHPDVRLSTSIKLQSIGKLSLQQYAQYLIDAAIGVSLMVSPHPSYPPLEMAAFGAVVITNEFENKNLSSLMKNIISLREVTPENIAETLAEQCDRAVSSCATFGELPATLLSAPDDDEFPFVAELVSTWLEH
jgi:O-antigen biosynthesis protein